MPHILKGNDIGIISEAGVPCIADPGSKIVKTALELDIEIIPLVGPSSIILSLMASGLNGQNFSFVGYLPINQDKLGKEIKHLESQSKKYNQTQIFMETPYRNNRLLEFIKKTCSNETKLCIATEITLEQQKIKQFNKLIQLHLD